VGSVAERACWPTPSAIRRCSTHASPTSWKPPLPVVPSEEPVSVAVEVLVGERQALIVLDGGQSRGDRLAR